VSIRARLQIAILSLVITIVIALSLLSLHSVVEENLADAEERARLLSQMVKNYVLERITELATTRGESFSVDQSKRQWYEIVRNDQALSRILQKMMTVSSVVVEIVIVDDSNTILTGSNTAAVGGVLRELPAFNEWQERGFWQRLWQVQRTNQDFAISVPLGIYGQRLPVMSIKVLVSSVLLRNALREQLWRTLWASVVALGASVFLAIVVSNLVTRSLRRIRQNIQLIAEGDVEGAAQNNFESKELVDVQTMLTDLGKRFQFAREDATNLRTNIDQLLQRLEEVVLLFDRRGLLQMAGMPAERLFARKREEMVGKPFDEIFPSWTSLGAAVEKAVKSHGSLRDYPVTLERPNLPPAKLLVSVDPVGREGWHNGGTVVTLKDAETRRQLESRLDISNRLAAIGRITSGVAHEIKNPLNAITLHLEVARTQAEGRSEDLQRELDVISSEVKRLDRVVKTFLDFTRPLEINVKDCDLAQIVRDVAALVVAQTAERRMQIGVETPPDPAIVRGDPELIRQALLNVVLNAIDATPDEGRLDLKVVRAFDQYLVSVQDTGSGIPPEIQDKIFNLYFTTKPNGNGIGLAVTFRVVQLHSGTISFDSEVGKGTCFKLGFPSTSAAPVPQEVNS
jgi:signal transduction histidine kinase